MLEAEEKSVVVGCAVVAVEVHYIDKGIERDGLSHGSDVGVGLQDGVVPQAARVTKGSYELIAEVVLGIEREVVRIGCGQVIRKGSDGDASLEREIGAVKGADGVGVWRKAEERV
jgi:hypothetical protein